MPFYDQVLKELVLAIGAALFVANIVALVRRRGDSEVRRSGSERATPDGDLVQAPVGRTAAFAVLGFVMMIAGIAALTA